MQINELKSKNKNCCKRILIITIFLVRGAANSLATAMEDPSPG